jgi:hypothetical protein
VWQGGELSARAVDRGKVRADFAPISRCAHGGVTGVLHGRDMGTVVPLPLVRPAPSQPPALSGRALFAAALGGATALGDVVAPGCAPLLDLALAGCTAAVAADGVLAAARYHGVDDARRVFVAAVRDPEVSQRFRGPAATVLAVSADVLDGQLTARRVAAVGLRAAWSGLRRLTTASVAELVPGIATLVRAVRAGHVAREWSLLVAAAEHAAVRACVRHCAARRAAAAPARRLAPTLQAAA